MVRLRIRPISAPAYLERLLTEAEQTGFPIALSEEASLDYDALTRFASPEQPFHEISYTPEYRDHALHFLTVGLSKIARFYSIAPEERLVPATPADKQLPPPDHEELLQRIPAGADIDAEILSRYLFIGAVRQLISVPGDLRVERELHTSIPEHQEEQRRYLERQVADLEPHFSAEVAAFAPPRIYQASTAMNVVLAQVSSDIIGRELPAYVRASPHRDLGNRLRSRLDAEAAPGCVGDRRVTDAWAEELGMQGWFEWTPLR
jgi:hypothetical protein